MTVLLPGELVPVTGHAADSRTGCRPRDSDRLRAWRPVVEDHLVRKHPNVTNTRGYLANEVAVVDHVFETAPSEWRRHGVQAVDEREQFLPRP